MRFILQLHPIFSCFILFGMLAVAPAEAKEMKAVKGRIDFGGILQVDKEPVKLAGTWEFYWKQLLMPAEFDSDLKPIPSAFADATEYWNGLQIDGEILKGSGYATYRLVIDNIIPYRMIQLEIPNVQTAYKVYINGVFIVQCGQVGKSKETSIPKRCPELPGFYLDEERLEIIFHISNYHNSKGGFWQVISLGDYEVQSSVSKRRLGIDLFLIGALFIMGLYYVGVFTLRQQEKATLYFGLFCLIMALRTSFHNATFLWTVFPNFSWIIFTKLDYLTLTIPVMLFLAFVFYLYPQESHKYANSLLLTFLTGFSLFTVLAPTFIFTGILQYYQILILMACIYILYTMVLAIKRKRNGALEMIFGVTVLIASIVNDILHAQSIINSTFVVGYGLLFFFFSQSYVLTKRFTNALRTSEELSHNLEMKVKDQTGEIRDLLDNTGQGILSFDETFTVQDQASRTTVFIFEKPVRGENILELMFPDSREEIAGFMEILFQSGGKINLVKDMLPHEFVRNDKYYEISFRWIPAGRMSKDRVMVILTDVTIKRKLEKMLEKDELRNKKIIRIAVDRYGFLRFYNNVLELIKKIEFQLKQQPATIVAIELSRFFHTIKGGLSSYSFEEAEQAAHMAESTLEETINSKQVLTSKEIKELLEHTTAIKERLQQSVVELGDLIPKQLLKVANKQFFNVAEDKINRLEQYIALNELNNPELNVLVNDLKRQPMRNMMKKIASDAKEIAFQLGKQIEVNYSGEENQIIHSAFNDFFANLIHIVRNAIDHGIEIPAERIMLKKPETGRITIDISIENDNFIMIFADDGKGVDVSVVKKKALEKGLLSPVKIDGLSDQEAKMLIFQPGFSTISKNSHFSGRGIGMNAIAESVYQMGGTVEMDSELGKGTTFTFTIPVII